MFSIQGFLTCQSKLPMNYKHLSQVERYQIYALMKAGHDQTQIAKLLDRHKSTISREVSRNCGLKGYRPKQACELTAKRSEQSRNAATVPAWVCEQAASGHGVECVWCDAAQQEGAVLHHGGPGQCAGARKADEQARPHGPELGATGFGGA